MRFLLIAGLAESLLNFRLQLIQALQREGVEVHVAAPDLPSDSLLRHQLENLGLHVHEIPLRRTGTNVIADTATFFSLWRLMRRIRPTHVLPYTIKPVIYGMLAARMASVPQRFALVTGLGYAFTGQATGLRGRIKILVQGLYKQALSRTHKVFFQNPDDLALFQQLGLLSAQVPSVVVNGSGIDVGIFQVPSPSTNFPSFLLIARLLGDKGVREYAQAARYVRAKHPEAHFALAGWIDENPDAIRQAELDQWVQEGTLKYLGRLSDVRPAIAKCSVYVLPSYREGTPRTVLEAMAMGRAVITTDAPGCRETVVDGDNGFLVPVKSVNALVQAMLRFIDEPDLAARMGLRGRQVAEEKYDVRKVNAKMLHEMGINS